MSTLNLSTFAPNFSTPTLPEVPTELLNEWIGDTYPAGEWYVDLCQFEGLDALVKALKRAGRVTFTVAMLDASTFAIREASPIKGKGKGHHSVSYPERAQGARGPMANWSEVGEDFALRCFICSHASIGEASTWEVWREAGITFARLVD